MIVGVSRCMCVEFCSAVLKKKVLMEDSFVLMLKSCAVNCYDMLFVMLRRFARR